MTDQTIYADLHSDLRSPSVPPRRAHAQAQKWRHTTTTPSTHWTSTATPPTAPIPRPSKPACTPRFPSPPRSTTLAYARMECADQSCVRGYFETCALDDNGWMPAGVPMGDEAIFFSFERDSPAGRMGLDGLVDRAEERFRERETERIVRAEWEVLDGEGERMGRRGGKRSVSGERGEEVEGEVGGDWEAI
ncbi:hypothetical protein VE03_02014 [Pseudogymnoascus sp. 23342-1-I1]|nr:hypothetical protein VE03_02014 [Pseudogymnoascus sp. 23342-1-I1]